MDEAQKEAQRQELLRAKREKLREKITSLREQWSDISSKLFEAEGELRLLLEDRQLGDIVERADSRYVRKYVVVGASSTAVLGRILQGDSRLGKLIIKIYDNDKHIGIFKYEFDPVWGAW